MGPACANPTDRSLIWLSLDSEQREAVCLPEIDDALKPHSGLGLVRDVTIAQVAHYFGVRAQTVQRTKVIQVGGRSFARPVSRVTIGAIPGEFTDVVDAAVMRRVRGLASAPGRPILVVRRA